MNWSRYVPTLKAATKPPLAHPRDALAVRYIGGKMDEPGLFLRTEMDCGGLAHWAPVTIRREGHTDSPEA